MHSHTLCDPTAFQDICSRTWASRTWTFQEILLSPRPLLCCGTKTLSWRSFIHTLVSSSLTIDSILPAPELRWINILKLWASVQDSGELRDIPDNQQFLLQTYIWDYRLFIEGTRMVLMIIKVVTLYLAMLIVVFGVRFSTGSWEDSELLKASRSSEAWLTEFILDLTSVWVLPVIVFQSICVLGFSLVFILLFRSREREHMSHQKYRKSTTLTFIDVDDAIIYEIVTRKATNPKDKSFGMRAIFNKIGIQLDDPDYDKDIYQIYRELFVQLSDWSKSLRLLLLCHATTSTLPSWMPNWDIDSEKVWLNPNSLTSKSKSTRVFFRARARWSLTDKEELVVRGVHVCRISWSCGRFHATNATDYMLDEQSHLHNISMIHGLMRRYKSGRWTPTTDSDRHCALLHWERNKDPKQDKRRLNEWGRMMRRTSTMPDSSMSAFAYLKSHPKCFEFHTEMCNDLAKRERTLFLTEPDILGMGNGPTNIQVADLVTLVAGVSKPLILESRDTRYRLKGFAEMENEGQLASRANDLNTSGHPLKGGWEDLGAEMQPRDEIIIY